MMPDKEGYWWLESGSGIRRVAEVIKVNVHLEMILPGFSNSFSLRHTCVDRWLGPVNPEPMKVGGE